jgi:hypothetical protein
MAMHDAAAPLNIPTMSCPPCVECTPGVHQHVCLYLYDAGAWCVTHAHARLLLLLLLLLLLPACLGPPSKHSDLVLGKLMPPHLCLSTAPSTLLCSISSTLPLTCATYAACPQQRAVAAAAAATATATATTTATARLPHTLSTTQRPHGGAGSKVLNN